MLNLKLLSILGLYKSPEYDYWRFETLGQLCTANERVFWDAGYFDLSKIGELWPQYVVAHYRVDFALIRIPDAPQLRIAIEIDDQASHSSQTQRAYDANRERYLQRLRPSWKVVRFTASELVKDPPKCVRETIEITQEYLHWLKVR